MNDAQARSRFALNLSLVFAGQPPALRAQSAAMAGFTQVEMWWPFDTPKPTAQDIAELLSMLNAWDSALVCLNIDAGDLASGERGLLSDPDRVQRCRDSIVAAVATAAATGCLLLNLPYGNRLPEHDEPLQHETAFGNLLFAADRARTIGAAALVEPLNPADNPGYLLDDAGAAADLVRRAREQGAANVGLLLDVYHIARTSQDPCEIITRHAEDILHVQFADVPGRGCPGTGDLDFTAILTTLDAVGYRGGIGLEFSPTSNLVDALDAARRFVARHPAEAPRRL
jgi:hydroxypyruvate isomerase